MKKFAALLLTALMTLGLAAPVTALAAYQPGFELRSPVAYMVNLDTQQVMVEKNAAGMRVMVMMERFMLKCFLPKKARR